MTARKLRQHRLAEAVIQSASDPSYTLTQIGNDLGFNAKPELMRQAVYSSIRQPGVQAILAQSVDYDKAKLRRVANKAIDNAEKLPVSKWKQTHVRVLELGMKTEGMLIDRQESVNANLSVSMQIQGKDTGELVSVLTQRLKASQQGLRIAPQSSKDDQGKAISVTDRHIDQ